MNLTQSQKTALKTHITANTNTTLIPGAGGTTFVINTRLTKDPSDEGAIADWYNQAAKANDNQPFANLNVWNPQVTQQLLNSAIPWGQDPRQDLASPTDVQLTNAWLKWQTMIWSATQPNIPCLDMSDNGVRNGVLSVWGDVDTGGKKVAFDIGAVGCGQMVGKNIELALSNAVTGASAGTAFANAHPVQKDAGGATIYGQKANGNDIDDALANG